MHIDHLNTYIGSRLRKQRRKMSLSQQKLAAMVGCSHQLIQKQENGETRIPAATLYLLSEAMGVPPGYFYEGYVQPAGDEKALPKAGDVIRRHIKTSWSLLLVEDNPEDDLLFRKAMEQQPSEIILSIHTCPDGTEAIKWLTGQTVLPDIIFLDLNLPRESGLEFLKKLKKNRHFAFIPVIILTNSVDADEMLKCYEHHCSGYLCKLFDIHRFSEHLDGVLSYWTHAVVTPQNY